LSIVGKTKYNSSNYLSKWNGKFSDIPKKIEEENPDRMRFKEKGQGKHRLFSLEKNHRIFSSCEGGIRWQNFSLPSQTHNKNVIPASRPTSPSRFPIGFRLTIQINPGMLEQER
jgi:hypothetical protein